MAALDFPDAPTNGQVYDKWTWNGTQWVLTTSGDRVPRGRIVWVTSAPAANQGSIGTTATDIAQATATFNAQSNRYFVVSAGFTISAANACIYTLSITDGANTVLRVVNGNIPGASSWDIAAIEHPMAGNGNAAYTVKCRIQASAGTISVASAGYLMVNDLGGV